MTDAYEEARRVLGKAYVNVTPAMRTAVTELREVLSSLLSEYDALKSERDAWVGHHEVETKAQAKRIEELERENIILLGNVRPDDGDGLEGFRAALGGGTR